MKSERLVKIPAYIWWIVVGMILWGFSTPNPIETITAVVMIPVLIRLVWRKNEPPVLFFVIITQWLAITVKVFFANINGLPFNDPSLHLFPENIQKAFFLSMAGLLSLAIGIKLATRRMAPIADDCLSELIKYYDTRKATKFYVIFSLCSYVLAKFAWSFPGITQYINQVLLLKWGFFFLMCFLALKKNELKKIVYLIIFVEIIIGFGEYFASFKEYLIYFIITVLSLGLKLKPKKMFLVIIAVIIATNLLTLWTYSKVEYRSFISQEERVQIVKVPKDVALTKFLEIVGTIDKETYREAFFDLIDRVSYIDFFSACLNYVPSVLPYQRGRVWKDALLYMFKPRIFFSDKASLDDSQGLREYTGVSVSGVEEGTSIALGYFGDNYVDFGFFMFIPIALMGFFIGFVYKVFLTKALNTIWGYILVIPLFSSIGYFETSLVKKIMSLLTYLIIVFIFMKLIVPTLDKNLRIYGKRS